MCFYLSLSRHHELSCILMFRKLAQVHHPDKSTKTNKDANEAIFMEIAAAYEVLSDENQRDEYNTLRAARIRANRDGNGQGYHHQQRYQYQDYQEEARRQYQAYQEYLHRYHEQQRRHFEEYHQQENYQRERRRQQEAFQQAYDEYIEEMESVNSHNTFGPVFTGSFYPSGSVILPYNPIIVSSEGTHFALLDVNCTLAVYKGNPDELMSYLLRADSLDLRSVPYFEELYRSENKADSLSSSALQGNCFTGLDDSGVIRIFAGHPDDMLSREVWASSSEYDEEQDAFRSLYVRFFLELSNSGELFILSLTAGSSDVKCVWATTSCNMYVAIMKDIQNDVGRKLVQGFKVMKRMAKKVSTYVGYSIIDFRDEYDRNGLKSATKELLLNSIGGLLSSIDDVLRSFVGALMTIMKKALYIMFHRGEKSMYNDSW